MGQDKRGGSFRKLVFRAAVLPVFLLVGLAAVLVVQIQGLLRSAASVEHSDHVITNASRMLRNCVDMETGMRGFLLTKNRLFLQPFDAGHTNLIRLVDETKHLVADDPKQQATLANIDAAWQKWKVYADGEITRWNVEPESMAAAMAGKQLMDAVREQVATFVSAEEAIRKERGEQTRQKAKRAVWIACGAALAVGAVLGLSSRRELRRLAATYEQSLETTQALTTELEQRVEARTTELAHSNAALGEANKELEAFAYSISHDLRAPLRHIGGFADLLRRSLKDLSQDDDENLTTISDTAKLAGRMVDDLLAFSRIGRADLRQDVVDLNDLIDRCRRELEPETRGRDITWSIAELPPAKGDTALIKLVVSNLLSNAIKYTSKQASAVIDFSSTSGDDGFVTYVIRDNGVGFDMAYAHKLFGVFQRLHRAEEYEGTGIGLANVRRIISRHGGRVWAEGRPDNGATFYFTLPIGA